MNVGLTLMHASSKLQAHEEKVGHAYDDNEPFKAKIYLHYSGSTILCPSLVGNVGAGSDIVGSVGEVR